MKIHVHLWHALDVERYRQQFSVGRSSDLTPYGYHHAEKYAGNPVTFSWSHRESRLVSLIRKGLKWTLGFDLMHFWRNRHSIRSADAVWTHTEAESLAVALMLRSRALGSALKQKQVLILQSVWLVDRWASFSGFHRFLYRRYLARADALTFHSPSNLRHCEIEAPRKAVMWFGISAEAFPLQEPQQSLTVGRSFKVLAVGNDIHRNWDAMTQAFGNKPNIEVRVASSTFKDKITVIPENFICGPTKDTQTLLALYRNADLVVLPLHENLHASGLTVMLEAVTQGVPVLATRTGGLDAYFLSGSEVQFYEGVPSDGSTHAESLWTAAHALLNNPERRYSLAVCAQARFIREDFTSAGYARRQFELSKSLLTDL